MPERATLTKLPALSARASLKRGVKHAVVAEVTETSRA